MGRYALSLRPSGDFHLARFTATCFIFLFVSTICQVWCFSGCQVWCFSVDKITGVLFQRSYVVENNQ
jgi:hypothetical protein